MISSYDLQSEMLHPAAPSADRTVWWDLLRPTAAEIAEVEAALGLELPTQDEMQEIEASSRLYSENGAHFMTALIPSQTEGDGPEIQPVSFVLLEGRLVTIRYSEPRSFDAFARRAAKVPSGLLGPQTVLLGLLEAVVDRLADIMERTGREIDAISRSVFGQKSVTTRKGADYQTTLEEIGRKGDLTSNIRDSLGTLARVLAFLGSKLLQARKEVRTELKALVSDVRSLSDHANFMAQKISFLLEATLGLINIEQNAIIKIFSVVAVIFLPPTLVASIYGMNFEVMPELGWRFGYPLAIAVMILSAIVPYQFFKHRGWL